MLQIIPSLYFGCVCVRVCDSSQLEGCTGRRRACVLGWGCPLASRSGGIESTEHLNPPPSNLCLCAMPAPGARPSSHLFSSPPAPHGCSFREVPGQKSRGGRTLEIHKLVPLHNGGPGKGARGEPGQLERVVLGLIRSPLNSKGALTWPGAGSGSGGGY